MKTRRLWLCLPPTVLALLDGAVTTLGQSPEYWAGDPDAVNEANPLVRWVMTLDPVAFHSLMPVWILLFCAIIVKAPRLPARMMSLAVTFSHTFFTCTWIYHPGPNSYFPALALCIASAIGFIAALELSGEEAR